MSRHNSPHAADDYTVMGSTLTFPAGETEALITVDATADGISELLEKFTIILANPSESLSFGADIEATIDIKDNDS